MILDKNNKYFKMYINKPKLTNIDLSKKHLTQIDTKFFHRFINLVRIDLSHNELTFLDSKTFNGLVNLSFLSLSNNNLTRLDGKLLRGLTKLKGIWLSNNRLKYIDPKAFNGLTKLSEIWLNNNQIRVLDSMLLSGLVSLNKIYLAKNQLIYLDGKIFNGLKNLNYISISNNPLNRLNPRLFTGLVKLKGLWLSNIKLKFLDSKQFKGLVNLSFINLQQNLLEFVDPKTFQNLNMLTTIRLHENKLTGDKLELYLEKSVQFISFKKLNENDIEFVVKPKPDADVLIYKNKYKRLGFLGRGAFAKVFKVENIYTKKLYALKIIMASNSQDEPTYLKKNTFPEEAKLLKKLKSAYVIEYEECFFEGMNVFIVTEYCKDGDLAKRIKEQKEENKMFTMDTVYLWAKEMIYGIDFLHTNDIIHRDIKPGNIFLHNGHVKLGDLGIARIKDTVNMIFTFVGTFFYMSPEMLSTSGYDYKTDVWSTGCIVFELVTLEQPFKGNSLIELAEAIFANKIPEFNAPKHIKLLVKMMLQKNPDYRAGSRELKLYLED